MGTLSTTPTRAKNTRSRNSSIFVFPAAYQVSKYPDQDSKTTSSTWLGALDLTSAGGDPVNNSDPSGMSASGTNLGLGILNASCSSANSAASASLASYSSIVREPYNYLYAVLTRSEPYRELRSTVGKFSVQYNFKSDYFHWGAQLNSVGGAAIGFQSLIGTANYSIGGSALTSPTYYKGPVAWNYHFHSSMHNYEKWFYLPFQSAVLVPGTTLDGYVQLTPPDASEVGSINVSFSATISKS